MTLVGVLQGFIPALTLFGVNQWLNGPPLMEQYEMEFIEMHKDENEFDHHIPSGFDDEDAKFLSHLCAVALNVEESELPQTPEVEDLHIKFKKELHLPFLVRIIRCSKDYAVIKAPQTDSAFLLKKGEPTEEIGNEIFYFHWKFHYGVVEMSPEAIRSRIEAHKNKKKIDEDGARGTKRSTAESSESDALSSQDGTEVEAVPKNVKRGRVEQETLEKSQALTIESPAATNLSTIDEESDKTELRDVGARSDSESVQSKPFQSEDVNDPKIEEKTETVP